MRLELVCDTSGSMNEGGKPFIMRATVMAISQWVRLGYAQAELKLCGWASKARHFPDWSTKDEYPAELLSCTGNSHGDALIHLLGEKPDGKVMLLTDGYWATNEARVLKRWKDRLPPNTLRIIKIGADANPQLKGPEVFAAEELFVALDGWLAGGSA